MYVLRTHVDGARDNDAWIKLINLVDPASDYRHLSRESARVASACEIACWTLEFVVVRNMLLMNRTEWESRPAGLYEI